MAQKLGECTLLLKDAVNILSYASVVAKKEGEGPLKEWFDVISEDTHLGEKTWEKAESKLQKTAVERAVAKSGVGIEEIDCIFAGDLMNQCIASTFALRDFGRMFLGLYGACSTMAESIVMGSVFIDSGAFEKVIALTSSHFCASERQYRFPLEYASVRTPTAQWTVTGAGAVVLSKNGDGPFVKSVCVGKIIDLGITDQNNMGAAMAPAAAETIKAFLNDTATDLDDYDAIFTGDLGSVGSELLYEILEKDKINIRHLHRDCGMLIYNPKTQANVNAGGSGCGCSASVLCSYILGKFKKGEYKDVLFVATGALMSPTSTLQGETIPSIAHLIHISASK